MMAYQCWWCYVQVHWSCKPFGEGREAEMVATKAEVFTHVLVFKGKVTGINSSVFPPLSLSHTHTYQYKNQKQICGPLGLASCGHLYVSSSFPTVNLGTRTWLKSTRDLQRNPKLLPPWTFLKLVGGPPRFHWYHCRPRFGRPWHYPGRKLPGELADHTGACDCSYPVPKGCIQLKWKENTCRYHVELNHRKKHKSILFIENIHTWSRYSRYIQKSLNKICQTTNDGYP